VDSGRHRQARPKDSFEPADCRQRMLSALRLLNLALLDRLGTGREQFVSWVMRLFVQFFALQFAARNLPRYMCTGFDA
jgi:hypothetical protein